MTVELGNSDHWSLRAAHIIRRYAWLIILIALLLAALAADRASRLKISTNLEALMPDGVASVENLDQVLKKAGSFASAMVVVRSDAPDAALAFVRDLRARVLADLDWVAAANYSEDIAVFDRHKLLYVETEDLEEIRRRVQDRAAYEKQTLIREIDGIPVNIRLRSEPSFDRPPPLGVSEIVEKYEGAGPHTAKTERLFQSADGKVTILVVWPGDNSTGLGNSRRIVNDLQAAAEALEPASYHPSLEVGVGGRIRNRVAQFDAVIADVKSSAGWSGSLIAILLMVFFRNPLAVVYILLPLATGLLWAMGVAQVVIGGLNLITVFLILILFGLGVDFGIHNMARYLEARRAGASVEEGLATILRHTGRASLLAAITTTAGFYALLLTDFRAIYEFGFIAGTGIVLAFIAMYTLFPAFIAMGERLNLVRGFRVGSKSHRVLTGAYPRPITTLAVVGSVLATALVFAPSLAFEDNFKNLEAEKKPEHQETNRAIRTVFKGGSDRAVLYVETLEEVKAIEDYFAAYIAADTETPTIRKVESIYTYLPREEVQRERLAILHDIETLAAEFDGRPEPGDAPEGWRDYLATDAMTLDELPEGIRRIYSPVDGSDGYLMYIFNAVSLSSATKARQFSDDIREFTVAGKTYHPAAEGLVFVDMLRLLKAETALAVFLVTATTFLVLFLAFRSLWDTITVLAPTVVGVVILIGIMGAFEIRLSIMNVAILPSLIGIGVDNAIHIIHRFKERPEESVVQILNTTGRAAMITTITTMIGFAGLLSAAMAGLRSLGLLAVIGFTICLVTTLTILPAMLQLTKARQAAR